MFDFDTTTCFRITLISLLHFKLSFDLEAVLVDTADVLEVTLTGSHSLCSTRETTPTLMMHRSDDVTEGSTCSTGNVHKLCTIITEGSCAYRCQCDSQCTRLSVIVFPVIDNAEEFDVCEISLLDP